MKQNKWKKRFAILLISNIVILLCIAFYFYSPIPKIDIERERTSYENESSSEFIIRTSKRHVNNLVNAYLDKLLLNTNHEFYIEIDDSVNLYGEIPIFSSTVPLHVQFEPEVQKNGDLSLKQKSISVGDLKLPNKKIMQYIDQYLPTPEWVIINPREQEIYVKVTEMDIRSNFHVAVHAFNLEKNNIAFKIDVPFKTLGIDIPAKFQEAD